MILDRILLYEAQTTGSGAAVHQLRQLSATYEILVEVANSPRCRNREEVEEMAKKAESALRTIIPKKHLTSGKTF